MSQFSSKVKREGYAFRVARPLAALFFVATPVVCFLWIPLHWSAKLAIGLVGGIGVALGLLIVTKLRGEAIIAFLYQDKAEREAERALERARVEQERERLRRIAAIKPGDYFRCIGTMPLSVPIIFGQCLKVYNQEKIEAKCYSRYCPNGETGLVLVDRIIEVISETEFKSKSFTM